MTQITHFPFTANRMLYYYKTQMSWPNSVLQLSEQRLPFAVTLPALVTVQPLQNKDENTRISLSSCKPSKPNTLVYHTGYVTSNGTVTVNDELKKNVEGNSWPITRYLGWVNQLSGQNTTEINVNCN